MDDAQKLLDETEAAYADLKRTLAGLPQERTTEPWLGSWGVREILIHISGWHRAMVPALGRLARGQSPHPEGVSYDDFDAWNARFVEAKRGVGLAEILAELDASHRDFAAAAKALPAGQLEAGGGARGLIEGTGAQHYQEHAEQIRQWRAREGI